MSRNSTASPNQQLSLFSIVRDIYADAQSPISNEQLYEMVAERASISLSEIQMKKPIGQLGIMRSPLERKIRWHQQSLKAAGWITKTNKRGVWELTSEGRHELTKISPNSNLCLVAFSTKLGIAIWGNSKHVFRNFDQPITLCLSSPPYPLRCPRAYGNVDSSEYTDFICESLEPIVRNLKDGGSIALNVSNDIFMKGSPARSIYLEKLTIALVERLGLHLMDRLIWASNKPPGPTYWTSITRVQLNVGYEYVLWFTNNPDKVFSNNQRVLQPHSEQHKKFLARGDKRVASYCDGAHKLRINSYSVETTGRIPTNVLSIANTCSSQRSYKVEAKAMGLPVHGAPMPLKLASLLVGFLTPEPEESESLVVDHFGGSLTVPLAAELLGRLWVSCDVVWEYLRGAALRFKDHDLIINPHFESLRNTG